MSVHTESPRGRLLLLSRLYLMAYWRIYLAAALWVLAVSFAPAVLRVG